MLKIHRKLEYALLALQHMRMVGATGGVDRLMTARELCEIHPMPFDVLSKVLQRLARCGVLTSTQGAQGGYRIRADLRRYSLYDLSEALLGPMRFANCMDERCACQLTGSCTVISAVVNLARRVERLYREVSVDELLESEEDDEREIRERFTRSQAALSLMAGIAAAGPVRRPLIREN